MDNDDPTPPGFPRTINFDVSLAIAPGMPCARCGGAFQAGDVIAYRSYRGRAQQARAYCRACMDSFLASERPHALAEYDASRLPRVPVVATPKRRWKP